MSVRAWSIPNFKTGARKLKSLDKLFPKGLFVISFALLVWGLLGLLEYAYPPLNLGLQNTNFPPGVQFIHFFALILTGAIFVFGYVGRWPQTRYATMTMYAVLATICFIETIDFGAFGGGTIGVTIMLLEFALYIVLSIYLLRSAAIQQRFRLAPKSKSQ